MVDAVGLEINEVRFPSEEAKGIRWNDRAPKSCHGAHRAIALGGARTQVEICFEANGPTMAMPSVCLPHERAVASGPRFTIDIGIMP